MYKRIILMILVIGFLSCNPASAVNLFTNGDFETGDFTGWTRGYSQLPTITSGFSSTYGVSCSASGMDGMDGSWVRQTVDLTDVDTLTFYYKGISFSQSGSGLKIFDNTWGSSPSLLWSSSAVVDWTYADIDVSELNGNHVIYFGAQSAWNGAATGYFDNIIAEIEPTQYIVWSTWPEDSWAVGNYSMITVGLPRPPDPVDFYIKTPSTDYIKKPLTKSPLVKTWNYEESQWYYQYFHTVYHSQYGNYSCKIVNSSADFIEYNDIIIPYSSPDVPIPPVVTIPTPDPIETPPEWNVTIPEQYENVSWIFDYTDFWDELGTTLNDTLYSTVGLIFIPMESINESVYTVYTHVNTAADMVSGSEHTHVIVQVAWDVIPDSIKTVFIGSAAIGLCIFILHRRT